MADPLHWDTRSLVRENLGMPDAQEPASSDGLAMLQLRHLTRNALQRILLQISASGLRATPQGDRLADALEDRICLSARVSDALFGMTSAPGPLRCRLLALAEGTIALLAEEEQTIIADVTVTGICPAPLERTVLQVAHEMVANAVKHGMRMRLFGLISVFVRVGGPRPEDAGVTLLVEDDGWGPGNPVPGHPAKRPGGDGMPLMRMLAAQHGASVALERTRGRTIARLHLPHPQA